MKAFLRRFPRLYVAAQRLYYALMYFGETRLFGSRLYVWMWRWRYRRPMSQEEITRSIAHPHRSLVTPAVASFQPLTSVLEVGCGTGVNLALLARRFPAAALDGIDVSAQAIDTGRRWLREQALTTVTLRRGAAADLSHYPDQSYDVTLSDAALMYLGPDALVQTLEHFARISRKGIVLNEWSLPADDPRLHLWYDLHWVHNYSVLMRRILPQADITASAIPPEIFGGTGWPEYGALIVVDVMGVRAGVQKSMLAQHS